MKIFFSSVVFIALFTILISCNNNSTEPELQTGRRDYVWTVDTLNMPMNLIGTIWGSSPKDVWTTGAGGDSEDRLLHFDGAKWKTYTKESIGACGNTLFGFSSNDIWMGSSCDGRIWHYDGLKWSENYRHIVKGSYNVSINNIHGTSNYNVYACGIINYVINGRDNYQSFILHYDGNTWREIDRSGFNSQFLRVRTDGDEKYFFSYNMSRETTAMDTISFYKLKSVKLYEIYSNLIKEINWGTLNVINSKVYFLIDKDIYLYKNENFEKQISLTSSNFGYQFYGRNEKDIFLRMKDGLAHYNGTDIKYLYKWPIYSISIIDVPAIFDKEIFFCLWDGAHKQNMILHGVLKE